MGSKPHLGGTFNVTDYLSKVIGNKKIINRTSDGNIHLPFIIVGNNATTFVHNDTIANWLDLDVTQLKTIKGIERKKIAEKTQHVSHIGQYSVEKQIIKIIERNKNNGNAEVADKLIEYFIKERNINHSNNTTKEVDVELDSKIKELQVKHENEIRELQHMHDQSLAVEVTAHNELKFRLKKIVNENKSLTESVSRKDGELFTLYMNLLERKGDITNVARRCIGILSKILKLDYKIVKPLIVHRVATLATEKTGKEISFTTCCTAINNVLEAKGVRARVDTIKMMFFLETEDKIDINKYFSHVMGQVRAEGFTEQEIEEQRQRQSKK